MRTAAGLVLAALALGDPLVAAPSGSDALLFSDRAGGERRSGGIASCDDERCYVDRAAVPLADVVWIGLGVGEDAPPTGVRERGVVLADGSVRPGRLLGMSLGVVLLETEKLDRALVRWVRVAEVRPLVDVLVRRDGAVRTGELQGCAAGTCTMAGEATTRAELAWIGLGADPEQMRAPSAPQDPARDSVQFADGTVQVTPLVGVGANDVVAESGTFARAEIAWIYLAPPAEEDERRGVRETPPPGAPAPQRPPEPPPARTRDSPEPPTRDDPPPSSGDVGGRGALWTGTLHERQLTPNVDGSTNERTSLFTLRLREVRVYPIQMELSGKWEAVGSSIGLENEGSTVTTRENTTSGLTRCWGEGTLHETESGPAGHLYLKSRNLDLTPVLGFDVPGTSGRYAFSTFASGDYSYPMTCETQGRVTSGEYHDFYYPVIPVSHLNPREPRVGLQDPEARGLVQGRMQGSYAVSDGIHQLTVSWTLCRDGDACPPPPPLPPSSGEDRGEPPTDCDESRADRAQLDLRMDQWRNYVERMKGASAEFGRLRDQATQWEGDYTHAMRDCNLWDIAQVLIGLGTSGLVSGPPGVGQPQVFSEMVGFFDLVDKVASGDASWLLPNTNLPERWISIEDAWDIFQVGYSNLGQSSPQVLEERLRNCGANTLDAVLDGAYEYLRLIEELKPLGDRMNELKNTVRDKEEEILDFCLSHPKACEDYERCR